MPNIADLSTEQLTRFAKLLERGGQRRRYYEIRCTYEWGVRRRISGSHPLLELPRRRKEGPMPQLTLSLEKDLFGATIPFIWRA